jgi:hypothetical protein
MSQVTTRSPRARRSRKMTPQEATLLGTRRGEPLISGVTDGETFRLIVEPPVPRRGGAGERGSEASLFEEIDPLPAIPPEPGETPAQDLHEMGLPYRFALACGTREEDV